MDLYIIPPMNENKSVLEYYHIHIHNIHILLSISSQPASWHNVSRRPYKAPKSFD